MSLDGLPRLHDAPPKPLDPDKPTAVMMVGSYGGLGIHTMLSVQRLFPGNFRNWIFVSIGVIDSATFKGVDEVEQVRERTRRSQRVLHNETAYALQRRLQFAGPNAMVLPIRVLEAAA